MPGTTFKGCIGLLLAFAFPVMAQDSLHFKGQASVLGKSIGKLSAKESARLRRESLGFIFQSYNLLAVHTVFENVEFPCLVLFGNEGQGLGPQILERFPLIRLDQKERIDSLNVAVSACILMHEVKRIHGL